MNIEFDELLSEIGNFLQKSIIRLTISVFPTFTQRHIKRDLTTTRQNATIP